MPAKAFVVNGEVQIVSCKTGRKVCMPPLGVRENACGKIQLILLLKHI